MPARGRPARAPDPARALAAPDLSRLIVLCGQETFLVERGVATIRARADAGDVVTVWGDDPSERVAAGCRDLTSPGLFGGLGTLIVRRAEAIRGESETALERVVTALGDGRGGRLVLVAGTLDRRRRMVQQLPKESIFDYPALTDRRELSGWLGTLARERGVRLATDAAGALLDRCGSELAVLASELDKLALVASGGISLADVRTMTPATRAHGVHELTDRIAAGDRAGAIAITRSLLREGEPVPRLVAFVASNVRRALHVAELAEQGATDAAIAERLRVPVWLVRRQRGRDASRRLESALGMLSHLDRAVKRSRAPDALVEAAMARLPTTLRRER